MIRNEYVVTGVVVFGAGVLLISWWLVRYYNKLLAENERLRAFVIEQDLVAMETAAVITEHMDLIDSLQERVHNQEQVVAVDEPVARGRHVREEVSLGRFKLSNYRLEPKNPKHLIWAGWDPMLNSYFAHVTDTSKNEEDEEREVLWIGCTVNEIHIVELIGQRLAPYMKYDPEELLDDLYRDANT